MGCPVSPHRSAMESDCGMPHLDIQTGNGEPLSEYTADLWPSFHVQISNGEPVVTYLLFVPVSYNMASSLNSHLISLGELLCLACLLNALLSIHPSSWPPLLSFHCLSSACDKPQQQISHNSPVFVPHPPKQNLIAQFSEDKSSAASKFAM